MKFNVTCFNVFQNKSLHVLATFFTILTINGHIGEKNKIVNQSDVYQFPEKYMNLQSSTLLNCGMRNALVLLSIFSDGYKLKQTVTYTLWHKPFKSQLPSKTDNKLPESSTKNNNVSTTQNTLLQHQQQTQKTYTYPISTAASQTDT